MTASLLKRLQFFLSNAHSKNKKINIFVKITLRALFCDAAHIVPPARVSCASQSQSLIGFTPVD